MHVHALGVKTRLYVMLPPPPLSVPPVIGVAPKLVLTRTWGVK